MTTNLILAIGVMIILGFFGGRVAAKLKFPMVSGYLIVGILLSPSLLHLVPKASIESLDIVISMALGIIAYSIGGSLRLEAIGKLGKAIAWITSFQSLGSWFLTVLILPFLLPFISNIPNATFSNTYFPMALVIGAIACATAPAATMAIIHEYKARGPLTTTLLAVVALDDAIAVVAFAVALGIGLPLVSGDGGFSVYQMLAIPFLHIVESVAIGILFGFALVYIAKFVKMQGLLLVVIVGIIMLCTGVTELLGVSSILANMFVGFIAINVTKRDDMTVVINDIEDVVYAVFFVLTGMHFDLSVMQVAGILALFVIILRCGGKYFGTYAGAKIAGAPDVVTKYLGFTLLPKAGVTIGLGVLAESAFPSFGAIMFNALLASTIVNELLAPPLVRYAIVKSGENNV